MPHELEFVKMHGAGNDFIVMDARADDFPYGDVRKRTAELCHRRTGIGADGVLMLGRSDISDYAMHYLNADGSEAGMCGNGARCLARFAVMQGFSVNLTFEVRGTIYRSEVQDDYVSVHFPVDPQPRIITIEDRSWCELNTGTEHVVSIDPEHAEASEEIFRQTGRRIRNRSDLFPAGTNVNFAHIINENRVNLVTYERGVEDLTLACGTGAIATAITLKFLNNVGYNPGESGPFSSAIPDSPVESNSSEPGETEHHVQVDCPGGPLEVSFKEHRHGKRQQYLNIILHGPAVTVYHGRIRI